MHTYIILKKQAIFVHAVIFCLLGVLFFWKIDQVTLI